MSPVRHRIKESVERLVSRRFRRAAGFPWIRGEKRFLTVRMDLHNKCNIRCRMCYFALDEIWNQPMVEMSDRVIDRMEREIWPRTNDLWLSCATEPLISKKLGNVLKRAAQASVPQINLITNGLALNESKAAMLIEGELGRIYLSFDGATRETYEKIRTGSKFDRVLENMRTLRSLKQKLGVGKPTLCVIAVMMLENMAEWAGIVELAAELGADQIKLTPQTYYTEFGQHDRLWDHREEYNAALEQAHEAARRNGISIEAPRLFHQKIPTASATSVATHACGQCYLPWMQIVVYPSGEVTPCTPMYSEQHFGNLENQSFDEIYFGPAFTRLREELRTGNYNKLCRGCPAGHLHDVNDESAFVSRNIFASPASPG